MRHRRSVSRRPVMDRLLRLAGSVQRVTMQLPTAFSLGRPPVPSLSHSSHIVDAVRSHDFSSHSDTNLRTALHELKDSGADESLPRVFALVDEVISRRFGAWRLFSDNALPESFQRYRDCAERVLEAGPHRSHLGYYTNDAFLESPGFRRTIEPLLGEMDLDPDEATIVATMVYVAEKSKVSYHSQIGLPAEFYRVLSTKDAGNELSFQATDEQLMAGSLLYDGVIVEMNAGEGKTIAAAFPAVLHALLRRPVHIVTSNDYLAGRDAEWLAPVYESLGLSVRNVLSHMNDAERRDAYKGQIVYGTLREFGFDFLRDNLRYVPEDLVQRSLDVAIVDEADQALIDESRIPLIIAGAPSGTSKSIRRVSKVVELLKSSQGEVVSDLQQRLRHPGLGKQERCLLFAQVLLAAPDDTASLGQLASDSSLRRRVQAMVDSCTMDGTQETPTGDLYYVVDGRNELVTLTERGQDFLERELGPVFDTSAIEHELGTVESSNNLPLGERRSATDRLRRKLSRQYQQMNQVYQMLRACMVLKRDVDYVVTDGEVVLVDKLTGRTRPDSLYQHGLQACIQVKEGVTVRPESEVLGQISVQGFMKQYSRISGMTGTAVAARNEFRRSYGLDVVAVRPSNTLRRTDFPTRVFPTRQDKLLALVDEVKFRQKVGQPVLIGTLSVEQSEEISRLLEHNGVEHRLLNAVNTSEEAEVMRSAGSFGSVTVATNMAGRGTDIILEPGLGSRITERFASLVKDFLSDGVGQVTLACATTEEADIFESVLVASDAASVTKSGPGSKTEVVAVRKSGGTGAGRRVSLEFGAGLHVIGTEMNESRRIDDQLRGRGGRQGALGSSRSMLSLEDRPLVFHSATRSALSRETKRDLSSRTFFEGRRTDRRVGAVQSAIEIQDEVVRSAAWEYGRVIERQTTSFYRARWEVVRSTSFYATCEAFMRDRSRRIVDHYFPPSEIDRYESQFERMADELSLDYQVNVQPLWGLGTDALKEALEPLMAARLEETWVRSGGHEFDNVAKVQFLQSGDELWAEHLSRLHELMLTTRLCAHGQKAAVADYVHRSVDAYKHLREEIIDTFLPKLVGLRTSVSIPQPQEVNVLEEVQEILV